MQLMPYIQQSRPQNRLSTMKNAQHHQLQLLWLPQSKSCQRELKVYNQAQSCLSMNRQVLSSNNMGSGSTVSPTAISGEIPNIDTTQATCGSVAATNDTVMNSTIYGEQASADEIFQRLGITERADPPTFLIEPESKLYIIHGRPLRLGCVASGLSVIR